MAFACLHDYRTDGKEPGLAFLGLIIIGLLFFLTYYLGLKMKMSFKARAARKRAKRMESFFNPKREG